MATIAVFVALGGSSYAAVAITGKNVKNSSLTGKDVKDRSLLARDFRSGQLPAGPQGAKGDPGAPGTPGTPGAPGLDAVGLWAAVTGSNGSLARGSGVATSSRAAPGLYHVDFNRDVTGCAFVASAGNLVASGNNPPAKFASTAPGLGNANRVLVEMRDAGGYTVDSNFHLAVLC
jgi:hypothetical protein